MANTIGTVRVASSSGPMLALPLVKMTYGTPAWRQSNRAYKPVVVGDRVGHLASSYT
jgi:hypothetical protein